MDFKEIRQSKEYKWLAKIIQFCTPWILKRKLEEKAELKFVDKYNYKASWTFQFKKTLWRVII